MAFGRERVSTELTILIPSREAAKSSALSTKRAGDLAMAGPQARSMEQATVIGKAARLLYEFPFGISSFTHDGIGLSYSEIQRPLNTPLLDTANAKLERCSFEFVIAHPLDSLFISIDDSLNLLKDMANENTPVTFKNVHKLLSGKSWNIDSLGFTITRINQAGAATACTATISLIENIPRPNERFLSLPKFSYVVPKGSSATGGGRGGGTTTGSTWKVYAITLPSQNQLNLFVTTLTTGGNTIADGVTIGLTGIGTPTPLSDPGFFDKLGIKVASVTTVSELVNVGVTPVALKGKITINLQNPVNNHIFPTGIIAGYIADMQLVDGRLTFGTGISLTGSSPKPEQGDSKGVSYNVIAYRRAHLEGNVEIRVVSDEIGNFLPQSIITVASQTDAFPSSIVGRGFVVAGVVATTTAGQYIVSYQASAPTAVDGAMILANGWMQVTKANIPNAGVLTNMNLSNRNPNTGRVVLSGADVWESIILGKTKVPWPTVDKAFDANQVRASSFDNLSKDTESKRAFIAAWDIFNRNMRITEMPLDIADTKFVLEFKSVVTGDGWLDNGKRRGYFRITG